MKQRNISQFSEIKKLSKAEQRDLINEYLTYDELTRPELCGKLGVPQHSFYKHCRIIGGINTIDNKKKDVGRGSFDRFMHDFGGEVVEEDVVEFGKVNKNDEKISNIKKEEVDSIVVTEKNNNDDILNLHFTLTPEKIKQIVESFIVLLEQNRKYDIQLIVKER